TMSEGHDSSRGFVEGFYQWYVPVALSDSATRTWDIALKGRRSDFSPELARLLSEDSAAQAKCEELIGLDFDPLLNTQDAAERYDVGEITHEGQDYRAAIFSVQSGKRSEKPDVNAEFSEQEGHWVFVNFYYPDGTNLLKILKSPRPKCSVPRPASAK
ncbi:MAG: hypothetical protein ACRD28_09125, partial [Acidobacteriaceae bacterium]